MYGDPIGIRTRVVSVKG